MCARSAAVPKWRACSASTPTSSVFSWSAWGLDTPGFAGVLAGPYLSVDPALGANTLISCLIVVVVGGLGSVGGAIVAALVYGFIDVFGSLVSPVLSVMAPYLMLVFVLLWRPEGFGRGRVD